MKQRWKSLCRLWTPFTQSPVDAYAAGACFFISLSVFPTLLIAMSLLPLLPPISIDSLLSWLEDLVPAPIFPLLEYAVDTINKNSSIAILSVSSLVALWAASRGVLSIMDGMRVVLGMPQKTKFLVRRLCAILYFLVLMASFDCMLLIYVFGHRIYAFCIERWPAQTWLSAVFQLRNLYSLLLFAVLSALVYRLVSTRHILWRWCLLGGGLTSASWWLFSYGFSIYVNHFAAYRNPYGAIGTLILGEIWLYVCLLMFLYSGLFCYLLQNKSYHPLQILQETFSKRKSIM